MSYTDTTYTVQSGYAYMHSKQVYDVLDAQIRARAGWSFVESVDYVSGSFTATTSVYKCSAASSGLPADFYIGVRYTWNNSVPAGTGWGQSANPGIQVVLFEQYNSTTHTASKIACRPSASSQTLAADGTNTSTWVLSTAIPSDPNQPQYLGIGPSLGNVGTMRTLITVGAGAIAITQKYDANVSQAYVGAFDSLLGATLDPMPLVVLQGSNGNGANWQGGASGATTRHPSLGGATGIQFNGVSPGTSFSGSGGNHLGQAPLFWGVLSPSAGTVGLPNDPTASLWTAAMATKCTIYMGGNNPESFSTRGGLRGTLRHFLGAQTAPHIVGDTFTIDGVAYAGFGSNSTGYSNYALLDTTA